MNKKIIFTILFCICALLFYFALPVRSANSATSEDMLKLLTGVDYRTIYLLGDEDIIEVFINEIDRWVNEKCDRMVIQLRKNDCDHEHFLLNYTDHAIDAPLIKEKKFVSVIFRVDKYVESTNNSMSVTTYILKDEDGDGEVDYWYKYFTIFMDRLVIEPDYPHGYRNNKWFSMTKEEAQKLFDKEVEFFLKYLIKKE